MFQQVIPLNFLSTLFPCNLPFGNGAIGGIRTPDLCLRRALLYPAELQSQGSVACQGLATMERVKGIGPS